MRLLLNKGALRLALLLTAAGFSGLSGCASGPATLSPATLSPATLTATASPTVSPPTSSPPTVPPGTSTAPSSSVSRGVPATPTLTLPQPLIGNRTTLNNTQYVVFAWNDLGMHCANPSYDKAVLLPPYNTIWAQVIKRGNPPQVVTSGLSVEYRFIDNTSSYGKGAFAQFWDNAKKLFGVELARNTGLNLKDPGIHNGLSGTMAATGDHFEAVGIPLTPINDDGTWNPYQVASIVVKDASGRVVAQTDATAPISDEINCDKCHGADPPQDMLEKHDKNVGTKLAGNQPVLCAGCHGDPALGTPKTGQTKYLSAAVHGFHATVSPQPACYDCHPGQQTKCSRSLAHTTADGNCTTCHGNLAQVSGSIESGRIPWADEPGCVTCHPGVAEVDTQSTLYRNATGHGGVYCASCHSSPHAMVPTSVLSDNYQALQYQGAAKAIGSCGACHGSSRGDSELSDFTEAHGGGNPSRPNACNVCHTSESTDTGKWPHAFQWKATLGSGRVGGD